MLAKQGISMSQVISQTVFKPNPGADMSKLIALVAESAAIWRKHGAEVSVWTVKGVASGLSTWVRSNLARQIAI